MIHQFADDLFPGMKVKGCYQFRLTRNADLTFDKEDVADLASALEGELHARHYGDAVRLEVADNCPEELWQFPVVLQLPVLSPDVAVNRAKSRPNVVFQLSGRQTFAQPVGPCKSSVV